MLWCCIDMRLADDRWEHPLRLTSALGGYSKWLPPLGVILASLARVPGRPQKHLSGEFRVSSRYLPCGVSLPGGGTGGVGVDERVESASGMPTWFVLLDVDQVEREQAAQVCPLVETHRSVASFDHPNQAPDEEDGVRMVIPLPVSSVDLQGDRLVHAFSPQREGPAGTQGGCPGRIPRLPRP